MGGPRGLAAVTKRSGGAVAGGKTTARATREAMVIGGIGATVTRPTGTDSPWQTTQSKQSGI